MAPGVTPDPGGPVDVGALSDKVNANEARIAANEAAVSDMRARLAAVETATKPGPPPPPPLTGDELARRYDDIKGTP